MADEMAPFDEPDYVSWRDFEAAAAAALDRSVHDFVAGGVDDEITVRSNREAFDALRLVPRVLTGSASAGLSTTLLGAEVAAPVMVAPMGLQGIVHPDGEIATARAAAELGLLMVVGVGATRSLEEVASVPPGPRWFQSYVFKDRGRTKELAERAAAAGYSALCITVDSAFAPRRERLLRGGFAAPQQPNLAGGDYLPASWDPRTSSIGPIGPAALIDQAMSWSDIDALASTTGLPVVVKGVLDPRDARAALDHGAAAIVVSNHGGRQLDTSVAPIDAIVPIVDEMGDDLEVYLDGGVRRGTDVVKALSRGARAVLLGRPVLWALAVGGEPAVRHLLTMIRDDLANVLATCGQASSGQVEASVVSPRTSYTDGPMVGHGHRADVITTVEKGSGQHG